LFGFNDAKRNKPRNFATLNRQFHCLVLRHGPALSLNPRGIQHDTDAPTHGLGREVLAELCPHRPAVAMGTRYLAPDDPQVARLVVAGARRLLLGAVDIAAALAQVELCLLLQLYAVDAQERCVLVLVAQATLEAGKHRLDVQPSGLFRLGGFDNFRCVAHFKI